MSLFSSQVTFQLLRISARGFLQHYLVVGILPLHQFPDDLKQLFPLAVGIRFALVAYLQFLSQPGVIDQLSKEHPRPGGSQRSPCPIQMQSGRMTMGEWIFHETQASLISLRGRATSISFLGAFT
jgi:hypothetical protein